MQRKIMYISDFTLEQYNSVRDILYNIVTNKTMCKYNQIIVKSTGRLHNPIKVDYYEGYKTYSTASSKSLEYLKRKDVMVSEKIGYIFRQIFIRAARLFHLEKNYRVVENLDYIKKIIKKEKPQLVVFLTYSPMKNYAKICLKNKIPYISILYDTYIGRPKIVKEDAYPYEKYVIEHSCGYFIPSFFYDLYSKTYNTVKIKSMDLPLLIEENQVLEAYKNIKKEYDFTYFGHIQSFRNGDKIKEIFKKLNITLDVFSTEKYESNSVFHVHPAVTKDNLFETVAGSKYLVALDNSFPYNKYLPSKAYLYASFTKPIIAFGDNSSSALKTFFKDYPWFYYHNINDSLDGLLLFLQTSKSAGFEKQYYQNYSQYLPQNALIPLINLIENIMDK